MRKCRQMQNYIKPLIVSLCLLLTGCGTIGLAQEATFESAYENVPEEVILMMAQNIILMRDNQLAEAQYKLPSGKKLKMKYNGSDYTIECSKADKKKVHV